MIQDYPAYRKTLKALIGRIHKDAPATIGAFSQLHEASMKPDALNARHKELIALGIGIANRCDGCLAFHVHEALANGATHEEIVETIGIAVMMGGGPSMTYSAHAYAALEQFEAAQQS